MQSNSEDPPLLYISVGTEVSAKFKGAFCEAKISRVEKAIKCKVTFKGTGQQATISDELIRSSTGEPLGMNEFKIGSLVSILKTEHTKGSDNALQLAVLNKVMDQSSYTVIFNDGDEKVVRRSFIRSKGERHYLNSETLDNAPLNNPEHFLQPIKNNSSSDFPNSPLSKLASKLSPSLTERTNDTKRTSNNTDDESFDDSLYEDAVATPNSSTKKQKNNESNSESSVKLKKTNRSQNLKKKSQSDDEIVKVRGGNDDESSCDRDSDNNSSDDSSSSDDYPCELKDRFVAQLYKFMDDRGTSMNRVPTINGVDIDLHRFFMIVRRYGGYNKVCKQRAWVDVYKRLQSVPNFPNSNSSNVINLKSAYKRYLQPYEDLYRKLGSTMCDLTIRPTSSNSKLNDSHRSLQLFKNRYLANSNTKKKGNTSKNKQKQQVSGIVVSSVSPSIPKVKAEDNEEKSQSPSSQKDVSLGIVKSLKSSDIDIDLDLKTPASNENLTIESMVSSPMQSSTKSLIEDQPQQPNEEISLFSMVRKINENIKKVKKEKEKEKNRQNDASVNDDEHKKAKTSPAAKEKSKQVDKNDDKSKTGRRLSIEKPLKIPKTEKSVPANNKIKTQKSGDALDEYGDDDDDEEPKGKRKVSRLSVSGSEDAMYESGKKIAKRKKSGGPSNKSISSNNETNDETDDDKDTGSLGNPSSVSRSTSIDRNNDTDPNEKEAKTSNITFSDLVLERVIDVKYSHAGKMHNYRAKIIQMNKDDQKVLVHYLGWNSRYDEWIKTKRIVRLLSEDYTCSRRKKKNNKDLSIQPDIQPVSSPVQSNEPAPSTQIKSSPKYKAITQLKLSTQAEPFNRSLSCTSTCSSEQSKEESDASATEKISNESKIKKTLIKTEENLVPLQLNLTMKTRNSDSSGSGSSTYSYRNRSCDKADSDDQNISKASNISENSNQLSADNEDMSVKKIEVKLEKNVKSDLTENTENITSIVSIKEEVMDIDLALPQTPEKISKTDVFNQNVSFSSIEQGELISKKSPKKDLNTSRKNSLNDSDSRKSLVDSRKNSISDKPVDSPKKEDSKPLSQVVSESVSSQIELSFADTETAFATASSKFVAFDIESSKTSSNREKLEKETWEKICNISNSNFEKKADIEKTTEIYDNAKNTIVEDTLTLKEFVTNQKSNQKLEKESDKKKEKWNSPRAYDQEKTITSSLEISVPKEKNILNKENAEKKEKDCKKMLNEPEKLNTKNEFETKGPVNVEKEVLSVSRINENSHNAPCNSSYSKYSFDVISPDLIGKQRIRYIEEQMKLCRENYAKLKNEIAAIDRKKKKLKRSYVEKSGNTSFLLGNTTSNEESSKNEVISSKSK